jgi:transcriptional regulator with XRE-family HTH domain
MPKPSLRTASKYSRRAVTLLGGLIRRRRIERRLTTAELASRANISRGLVQRIEKGDLGCSIGAVFETAAIVGVRLFDADPATLTQAMIDNSARLTLLPKSIRGEKAETKDDF